MSCKIVSICFKAHRFPLRDHFPHLLIWRTNIFIMIKCHCQVFFCCLRFVAHTSVSCHSFLLLFSPDSSWVWTKSTNSVLYRPELSLATLFIYSSSTFKCTLFKKHKTIAYWDHEAESAVERAGFWISAVAKTDEDECTAITEEK